ncbi:Zinc finger homeobox protein 2, partial [Camelus dromedarius]
MEVNAAQTKDDDSPSPKVFCCLVCQAFSTDGLELLLCHCSVGGSLLGAEWKKVAGDTHRCKLCCYGTQLKANLQLHLKTDKHAQKYQTHSDSQAQRHLQLLLSGPTASEEFSAPQGTLRFSHGRLQVPGKAPIIPSAEPPTPEKDAQSKIEHLLSPERHQVGAHAPSRHAVRPRHRCPLCRELPVQRPALRFHLSRLHSVVPECVEKLLLVATTVEMTLT